MRRVVKIILINGMQLALFFLLSDCYAQSQKSYIYRDNCSQKHLEIKKEYELGHYHKMDSLFAEYKKSPCQLENKRSYQDILRVIIAQRLEDGYRVNEADSLQAILDSSMITQSVVVVDHSESWRIGLGQTIIWSNMGKTGWSVGISIAKNFQSVSNRTRGIETGLFYQRFPFSISAVNNKNKDNIYKSDGFVLETSGYSTVINIPIKAYVDLITATKQMRVGVGLFGGLELFYLQNTFINDYYHEHDYTSLYDSLEQLHYVTYKTDVYKGEKKPDFFDNRILVNLLVGVNGYYRLSEKWLITGSPTCSFMISGKLKVNGIDYSKQFNYFGIRATISYLFSRNKKKVTN